MHDDRGAGGRGQVFAVEPVELAEAAKGVLRGLARAPAGPPLKLQAVFARGTAPGEVIDAALPGCFEAAGPTRLAQGEQPLVTAEFTADGTRIEVPSKCWSRGVGADGERHRPLKVR